MLKRKVIFVLVGFGYLSPITTHVPVEKFLGPCPCFFEGVYCPWRTNDHAEREQRDTRINNPRHPGRMVSTPGKVECDCWQVVEERPERITKRANVRMR